MKILDYAYFTSDELSIHRSGSTHSWRQPNEPKLFFENESAIYGNRQNCIYCRQQMRKVFSEYAHLVDSWSGYELNMVFECSKCGWWKHEYFQDGESPLWTNRVETHTVVNAIVRKFNVSSNEIPLGSLQREAIKNQNLLYSISPRKMEELVRYCFESYYSCEVHHCGKSHDGGVDLLVVTSEEPILVQVKRRESPAKGESISAVRDFLGAMFLRQSKAGIFVTTASRFSREAHKAKETLLASQLVNSFDLIDIHSFISMLNVSAKKDQKNPPWIRALRDLECVENPLDGDYYKIRRDDYLVRNKYLGKRRARGFRWQGKRHRNVR